MHKLDERGSLLIPLILVIMLLMGALGFGAWAFAGRQDYKNNVDAKIDEAVEAATEQNSIEKEAEFAEREKQPFKTYLGPASLGSISVTYPKTWSAYVNEKGNGTTVLEGYMHPNYVPELNSDTSFALRFKIVNSTYDKELKGFEPKARTGKVVVAAYKAPKEENALGSMITGEIDTKQQGVVVLLPMRDKTIRIWTEGEDFRGDFTTMLESFTFNE